MPINKIAQSSTEIEYQNYISPLRTGQSISDTGWTTYVDSPGVNPVDGVSGTANLTWTQNLVNPLNADADLRLVKDASNRQGQGVSIPFTIDNKHLAKVLQITFDMELISGSYSNPIITPIGAIYTIAGTTCTVTAPHSFVSGQSVNMNFITGSTLPPNGTYIITATTSATFVFTVPSGAATAAVCTYTATADLRISIIQDPEGTSAVIEPVNTEIQVGTSLQKIKHIATFQTHISIRNYRLCIHVSSLNTPAYTIDFANFRIWEPTQSVGSIITDWQLHTLTASNTQGIGTPTSEQNVRWRRVGSNLEMRGNFRTGTVSANELRINFPIGLVANIPNNAASDFEVIGYFARDVSTTLANFIAKTKNGFSYFCVGDIASNTNTNPLDATGRNGSAIFSNGDDASFYLSVPIAGWGSSTVMSSDSGENRIVAARYTNGSSATVSTLIPFHFNTLSYDTHNGITKGTAGSSGAFFYIAPISGYYRISCCVGINSTNGVSIFVNDVDNILMGQGTNGILTNYSGQVFLNAGQKVDIRPNSSSFTSVSNANNFFSIERISAGSQTIALQETVAASYYSAATQTSLTAQVNFGIRIYDTHGAVTVGVGAWRFTAPISGKYLITGFIGNGTSINAVIDLFVNGSLERKAIHTTASGIISFSTTIHLLAGQFFDLRPAASMTVAGSASNDIARSRIDITRIGN